MYIQAYMRKQVSLACVHIFICVLHLSIHHMFLSLFLSLSLSFSLFLSLFFFLSLYFSLSLSLSLCSSSSEATPADAAAATDAQPKADMCWESVKRDLVIVAS